MGIEIIFTNFVRRGRWFYDIFAFFHVGRKCRNGIRPRNKIWNENFCHFQLLPGGSTPNHDNFNLFKPQHFCAFQHRMSSRNVFSSFPYYTNLSGRKLNHQNKWQLLIHTRVSKMAFFLTPIGYRLHDFDIFQTTIDYRLHDVATCWYIPKNFHATTMIQTTCNQCSHVATWPDYMTM